MTTDSELLRLYVDKHDERAFEELVRRHLGIVFNAALRRANGNRHLAEEATQLAFTQLAIKAVSLLHHNSVLGWLHTSTHYAVTVLIRREQRLAARHQTAATMNTTDSDGQEWDAIRPLIDDSLDALSETQRQAILLRYFSSRSFAEIGAELNVSENAARKCVERAMENLRRQFACRGLTTSASALGAALTLAPANAAVPPLASSIAATATANAAMSAAPTLVGVIGFMTTSKLISTAAVIAGVAALTGIGSGVVLRTQHQEQQRRQLAVWDAQVQATKARLDTVGRTTSAPTLANPASAPSEPPTTDRRTEWLLKQNELAWVAAIHPGFADIRQQEGRFRFLHGFGAFLATRNYPPEKIAVLRHAVVHYYEDSEATRAEAAFLPEKLKQREQMQAENDRALFERLSQTFTEAEQRDIRRCLESQKMVPAATQIGDFLEFDGVPLARVQLLAMAMINADAENSRRSASPEQRRQMQTVDAATGLSTTDKSLVDDAAAFLSPQQLSLYEEYLRTMQGLNRARSRAMELYRQSHPGT